MSETLHTLLENWTDEKAFKGAGEVELPFDLQKFCAEMDTRIKELEAEVSWLKGDIAIATTIEEVRELEAKLAAREWISVEDRLPECNLKPNSFGVQVIINPPFEEDGCSPVYTAFYGCRVTDNPSFYIFGRLIDVTEWQPLPSPPVE